MRLTNLLLIMNILLLFAILLESPREDIRIHAFHNECEITAEQWNRAWGAMMMGFAIQQGEIEKLKEGKGRSSSFTKKGPLNECRHHRVLQKGSSVL